MAVSFSLINIPTEKILNPGKMKATFADLAYCGLTSPADEIQGKPRVSIGV